jgi:type IV secretion system protein VirB1
MIPLLAVLTLAANLQSCAAGVSPRTLAAVVSVESGGWPLTIHDNTSGRSYTFQSRRSAESAATSLLAAGHNVDLGLAQINSANLPGLGLTPAQLFDSCTNLRAGATILERAYAAAAHRFGAGQVALRFALSAYNSGSMFAAPQYARRVAAAAGLDS